jgi:diguanylate cyclase (GGDEF)-like protein
VRPLRLALAAAVPIVVVTALATVWAGWYASRDHREIARLGAEATLGSSVSEAISAVSTEVVTLGALDALRGPVPAGLRPYLRSGGVVASGDPEQTRLLLEQADRRGARALERLRQAGYPVEPATARALSPLLRTDLDRALAGTPPQTPTAADYGEALAQLQADFAAAPGRTQSAVDRLVGLADEPPAWRQPGFVGALAGVWALAIAASVLVGRRIARVLERSDAARQAESGRADALARRNERLLALVDASRRLSSASDLPGVARAVAAEAHALLNAGAAAVYLTDGESLRAAAALGPAAEVLPAGDAGPVGRAVESGVPARVAAAADAAFPGLTPLAALAAPLVAGRRIIGAIAVARAGDTLPDDDDEMALRLIALAAGPAIEGARAYDSTAAQAVTDPLTGLGNRRRLDRDLAGACDGPAPAPLGLVMIDIDHFKLYNDTRGHPAGDAALRQVSALVAASVREEDVVYRFGGEELCVLLPGAGPAEARDVAERVRAAVAGHDFPGGDALPGGALTISVGVAQAPVPDAAALVEAADTALYRAKREGRNRVAAAA